MTTVVVKISNITVAGSSSFSPVLIKDQDGNTIATKTSGQTYTVTVLSEIQDDGPPYTNSIIDF